MQNKRPTPMTRLAEDLEGTIRLTADPVKADVYRNILNFVNSYYRQNEINEFKAILGDKVGEYLENNFRGLETAKSC